jgi:hypothetical protein
MAKFTQGPKDRVPKIIILFYSKKLCFEFFQKNEFWHRVLHDAILYYNLDLTLKSLMFFKKFASFIMLMST